MKYQLHQLLLHNGMDPIKFVARPYYTYTGLFISPSGISKIDCATTKTDTAERSISMDRESLQIFLSYLTAARYVHPW